MVMLYTINFILIGAVSLTALGIMIYWHVATAGNWRRHPSGRALMNLLAIVCFITANAAIQGMLPKTIPLEVKAGFYFLLYFIFIGALLAVGKTIRSEVRRGRRHAQGLRETGDITAVSRLSSQAEQQKEQPHDQ